MNALFLFLFTQFSNCGPSSNCCIIRLGDTFYGILHDTVYNLYYKKIIRSNINSIKEEITEYGYKNMILDSDISERHKILKKIISSLLEYDTFNPDYKLLSETNDIILCHLTSVWMTEIEQGNFQLEDIICKMELYIINLFKNWRVFAKEYIEKKILDSVFNGSYLTNDDNLSNILDNNSTSTNQTNYQVLSSVKINIQNFVDPYKILEDISDMIDMHGEDGSLNHINIIIHINFEMIMNFYLYIFCQTLDENADVESLFIFLKMKIKNTIATFKILTSKAFKNLKCRIANSKSKIIFIKNYNDYGWTKLYMIKIVEDIIKERLNFADNLILRLEKYQYILNAQVIIFFRNLFSLNN